jgi:hypothetical protein
MKRILAAVAALSLSAGAFAAGAANPTNELKIAPAQPAHGPESARTLPERPAPWAADPAPSRTPYGNVSSIYSNEGTVVTATPPALVTPYRGVQLQQSNELKIGPAAPAHGPAAATTGR